LNYVTMLVFGFDDWVDFDDVLGCESSLLLNT
jgi:hypothetical protein